MVPRVSFSVSFLILTSEGDFPSHQPRQQKVARGAEFLVLPLQYFALVNQRFSKLAEVSLNAWRWNKNLCGCQYLRVGVWLSRAADTRLDITFVSLRLDKYSDQE